MYTTGRHRQVTNRLQSVKSIGQFISINCCLSGLEVAVVQDVPVEQRCQATHSGTQSRALVVIQLVEVEHPLRQLTDRLFDGFVAPVDDEDAVLVQVVALVRLFHEAAESRAVGRYRGHSVDDALGCRVAPRLVVAGQDAQVAADQEFLPVEPSTVARREIQIGPHDDPDAVLVVVQQVAPLQVVQDRSLVIRSCNMKDRHP